MTIGRLLRAPYPVCCCGERAALRDSWAPTLSCFDNLLSEVLDSRCSSNVYVLISHPLPKFFSFQRTSLIQLWELWYLWGTRKLIFALSLNRISDTFYEIPLYNLTIWHPFGFGLSVYILFASFNFILLITLESFIPHFLSQPTSSLSAKTSFQKLTWVRLFSWPPMLSPWSEQPSSLAWVTVSTSWLRYVFPHFPPGARVSLLKRCSSAQHPGSLPFSLE